MHAAGRYGWFSMVAATLCMLPAPAFAGAVAMPDGSRVEKVDFERHVVGLLGRAGCNAGSCHGSFQGKGGLYLSLFGYSPEKDYFAFTRDGLGRRVNIVNPDQSLMLLKASGQVPHGGGKRFDKDSWQYNLVKEWIAGGASWQSGSGTVKDMEVTPRQHALKPEESKQLRVAVTFADGSKEDLTYLSDYRVNDDFIAEVSSTGEVKGLRPGDTAVVVSYRGNVRAVRAMVPVSAEKGLAYPKLPEVNYIDREVFAKLRTLNIVPSDLSSDSEFLRRLYIDTIGCLPSPDEVRAFLADKDPNKRTKKIDALLADPMHAALWATKLSDVTGNNVDVMDGPQQLRPRKAKMWHDWLRKRIADNVPYDEIVRGILTATSRDGVDPDEWVKLAVEIEQAAQKGFENNYADKPSLDLFWKRNNNNAFTLELLGEHTAAAFMGIRLECAQCHKHPFDRWTQADYRAYANIFGQVKYNISPEARKAIDKANAEFREKAGTQNRNQIPQLREVFANDQGIRSLRHPDSNGTLKPKALGGPEIELKDDARTALFQWLKGPDNPYFARSFVNRVWGHYMGVGLVEPVDNFSVANPPSNERLLDALAKDFIDHKFDIRHLERTILLSRTYQLSSQPNATNVQDRNNYSRAYVRRMMAEVVVDVLNSALATSESYGNDAPSGSRAIEVASNRIQTQTLAYVFRIFGRPPRTSTCDCERAAEPALPQTLYLMTDPNVLGKITNGRLKNLLADKQKTDAEVVEELFLATLCRIPTDKEKGWALTHVSAKSDRQAGFTDVVWALINTREFILNH